MFIIQKKICMYYYCEVAVTICSKAPHKTGWVKEEPKKPK